MKRQSAPMYDLFKLIVLLILLALLILMLFRPPSAVFPGVQLPGAAVSGDTQATEPAAAAVAASTNAPQNAEAPVEPTTAATLPAAETATATPSSTPTIAPTIERTAEPTNEPTIEPTLAATVEPTTAPTTAEQAPQATATPAEAESTTEQPEDLEACAALPSRLSIGSNARVMTNLHFRSSPGIDAGLIRTHYPGTIMEVIGGPQCIPYQGGAYLWWELQHPDGSTGWSAEGSISSAAYFLEPVD